MKRFLASVTTAALALGGIAVATAAPASAHTPHITADCDSVDVTLTRYAPGENHLTVTIDGTTHEETFGRELTTSYRLDPSTSHEWSVDVVAHDGSRFNAHESDTSSPCDVDVPADAPVQVGVYVYPKLDATQPASWENSGKQGIVTSEQIELPEHPWKKEWLVAPLDLDDVREVARTIDQDVTTTELCSEWGIQQDLVGKSAAEYTLPGTIEKATGTGIFPEGYLLGDDHQDVGALLPKGACDTAPAQAVTPTAPTLLQPCDADAPTMTLPADTEIAYEAEDGIVTATPHAGYTFGESLNGYVLSGDGTSATLQVDSIEPVVEDCDLVPGDIQAVCESDVPYLGYGVSLPEGYTTEDETPLTITFQAPEGEEDYVVTDQPLAGSILWPGASPDEPQQWPGWMQADDGSYVETDGNYAWTRAGVTVLFEVNPTYSTVVEYPVVTSTCANPPVTDAELVADDDTTETDDVQVAVDAATDGPALASTGATVAGAAGLAVLLIGGGLLVFWLRRRVQA